MSPRLPHRTAQRASTPRTYVAVSPLGGRGVFAAEAMGRGAVVEVCPVIVVPAEAIDALNRTTLADHWYGWGDDGDAAVALGHGSLYNHHADPVCTYDVHAELDALVVRTRRAVAAGTELTIDYTGGGQNDLWFSPADPGR